MTMVGVEVSSTEMAPGYATSTCEVLGEATSGHFRPEGYSLWLVKGRLDAGARMTWQGAHGDEAIYVQSGRLAVGDRECGAGGSIIVEAGVRADVVVVEDTELMHVGPTDPASPRGGLLGPAADTGRTVHVIPEAVATSLEFGPIKHRSFADSTCQTCRIALFRVAAEERYVAESHVHSEDEIIHVLAGTLRVGPQSVPAGASVAVPAGRRYGFRTDGPFAFLNYRRDASTVLLRPGSDPLLETVEVLCATPGL